ncbi:MAG: hypothetical protein GY757_23830 [bacterium]|nr:hypothetical protein [bacterium]
MKIILDCPQTSKELSKLLEGYLYGLGEVCHTFFGKNGELAMYSAIGNYFMDYLKRRMGIEFTDHDPWDRYCHIIKVFTSYGFYSHVELDENAGVYWMLESGQYAAEVWEEQGAWDRGTAACPLWSILVYSLSEINYSIILDSVNYDESCKGYESTFHFEKIPAREENVLVAAKKTLRSAIIPICCGCKLIRSEEGEWISNDKYFSETYDAHFSHTICPDCAKKLYPDLTKK